MTTEKCNDTHCAVHKRLFTRGREFVGTVINARAQKTATVEWERRRYLPKYERYMKARTRVKVHSPECMKIEKGDIVKIAETRPISKTKHFVIVERLAKDIKYLGREELMAASEKREEKTTQKEKAFGSKAEQVQQTSSRQAFGSEQK